MYWLKKVSLFFIVICSFASCSEKKKAPVFIEPSLLDTIFNSAYEGVIPCPNCPGIETTIRIYNDSTVSRTVYFQESNRPLETKIGTWKLKDSVFITRFDREKLFYKIKNSDLILRVGSDLKEVKGALSKDYELRKALPFRPEQIEGDYVSGDSLIYHKITIGHIQNEKFDTGFFYVNALDSLNCEVKRKALLDKDHQLTVPLDKEKGILKITFTKKEAHVSFKNISVDSVDFQCKDTLKMPSVEGIYKKMEL